VSARTVSIDCFVRDFPGFRPGCAVVAVDVIRATTAAVTAVWLGRPCFPAATIDAAVQLAEHLQAPLLAGELGGHTPYGFDLDNSPAAIAARTDVDRPLVLVSTTGTQLICEAAQATSNVYVACLRNVSAQATHLALNASSVCLVGAGSRGEFREEDQLCCAWIAERLARQGFEPVGAAPSLIERWRNASVSDILSSNSVRFLRSTGRDQDIDFVLQHVDDCPAVFAYAHSQISKVGELAD
jgi:2-phosphosulfolactate phosphatase